MMSTIKNNSASEVMKEGLRIPLMIRQTEFTTHRTVFAYRVLSSTPLTGDDKGEKVLKMVPGTELA